jgi:hypothetical protein
MHPVSKDTGVVRCVGGVLLLSLVVGCSGRAQVWTLPHGDESTGSVEQNLIYCGAPDEQGFREHYRLAVINRKLGYYPELASELGLSSVTNCEEARTFRDVYFAYSELYPAFDRDQPPAPMPDSYVQEPSGPLPTFEGPKLSGGRLPEWAYPNSPVVKFRARRPGGLGAACTGTVIAPGFILTVAHCLPSVIVGGQSAEDLNGYAEGVKWDIEWSDANGFAVGEVTVHSNGLDIQQYAHPEYMGDQFFDHDLAIVRLDPERYLPKLPSVYGGGAMRISLTSPTGPPHETDPVYFAGFASPGPGGQNLRYGQVLLNDPPTGGFYLLEALIRFPPGPEGRPALPRTFTAGTQTPQCSGDSGGPAYRIARVPVRRVPRAPGTEEDVPVMVGVTVGTHQNPPATPCSPVGATDIWTRTDENSNPFQKLKWIRSVLGDWAQSCKRVKLPGQTTEDLVQCWGDPCNDESDCDEDTEFCDLPGTKHSQCLAMVEDEHDTMPMPPAP